VTHAYTADDSRPTLEAPDDDPYLWLEEVDGARALAWVEAQNAATMKLLGDAAFAADCDALKAILDRPDNIPFPSRAGGRLYNHWQDVAHPRGLWRRCGTLDRFRCETPDWEVLLDLDALAAQEGEDWVFRAATVLPGSHDRAIVRLSRGGADAVVLREFDLATRRFVADGFRLAEAKSWCVWLDRDTLLLMSALGPGMATQSGYARTVRLWPRGTDPLAAPVIFAGSAQSVNVSAGVDRDRPGEPLWFEEAPGFFDQVVWLGDRSGAKTRLDVPTDAWVSWQRGWLAVRPRAPWTIGDATYGTDTVLGISLARFLAGDRRFTVLFAPQQRRALQTFFWCGGRLVLAILDNLEPVFEAWTPGVDAWSCERIAGLPKLGVVAAWPLDSEPHEQNGDLLASAQDPLNPASLFAIERGTAPALLKQAPPAFDPAGLQVTRHEAVSSDGTRIPYVQVGPPGESGDAPVHLYGYGGFEVSVLPAYNAGLGKLWLERGGTSVTAQVRGGREFGSHWHQAARRAGRRLAHDDFAAVAADLVRRGVTRADRIAAQGGSNGGLLIANMLTRYPERFGALLCTVPLIDMRRYTRMPGGEAYVDEYGDPDKPEDWHFIAGISAYHAAAPGKRYPPILFVTSRRDDRVHPGHARKMAAKLQAMGYAAHLYEPATGGHSHGKDHAEQAAQIALGTTFLRRAIGWGR
jgi:prolyl oligopeptidase